jgi:hypothetical protein
MNALDGTLSSLARLRSGSEPIASLYLDLRWTDEKQRERVRLFVQDRARRALAHYLPESPGRDGLVSTLDRLGALAAGLSAQTFEADQAGVALFACEALGLWEVRFFRRPFENELCLDAIPHLTQLARLAEDFEPALVVVPSQEGADVYEVTLGDVSGEASVRGFVPRGDADIWNAGTGKPGRHYEREKKDERHQEAFVLRNRRSAAAEVTRRIDAHPGTHVVLVGTPATVAAFERELPDRVRARIIARGRRPREWASGDGVRRDGVVAEAARALAHHERDAEGHEVGALVGEALRGGLAVVGPEDVVAALNQGRVHRLVVEADLARTGWWCGRCDALGITDAEACPYCGEPVRTVRDLREALVARTLAEGGAVEVVPRERRLHAYRGVGAFLRQTSASGLSARRSAPPIPPGGEPAPAPR